MTVQEALMTRRSIRKFKQIPIEQELLYEIAKTGTMAPSRGNRQALKFVIVTNPEEVRTIFSTIQWGCKVPHYKVFADEKRAPKAFIVVLIDREIASHGYEYEVGASVENILVAAHAAGLGSVWIKSFQPKTVEVLLGIQRETLKANSIIGIGYPDQRARITSLIKNEYTTKITKDLDLEVPKREKNEVIFWQSIKEGSEAKENGTMSGAKEISN